MPIVTAAASVAQRAADVEVDQADVGRAPEEPGKSAPQRAGPSETSDFADVAERVKGWFVQQRQSLIGLVAVAAVTVLALHWVDSSSPLTVSFDVWQDLGRDRPELNVVKLSNEYVAVVIYGSYRLDVRDINVDTGFTK